VLGEHGRHGTAVVVDGLLAAEDGVEALVPRVGGEFRGDLARVLRIGVDADGLVGPDGERLAEDGLHVGASNRGDHDLAPSGLDELEGPDERVPLVVGIDDELNPFLIEAGVALRERDARRGVGGFADADEKFHAFSLKVGACAPDFEDAKLTPGGSHSPPLPQLAREDVTSRPANRTTPKQHAYHPIP